MLLYAANPTRWSTKCPTDYHIHSKLKAPNISNHTRALVSGVATALLVLSAVPEPPETLSNIPQTLSSVCSADEKDCKKRYKIQRPKSKKAAACTSKCSSTCMQGGFGSPGEGPFNTLSPLVVFKDGFRSRKYCLSECSEICNLIADRDGDDGP